ncbi:fimbria/pilus periplasmic chaperone [Escherichia coli]|uniref:Fimbria/pilus periplasmic chaperone n=1 Tax=Phytobacter palmae TaxID=1855371 RepID=A0ABU9V0J3_9ENTR|nr:fimbria/pilus periplasmic chaperone [Escherichia coli]
MSYYAKTVMVAIGAIIFSGFSTIAQGSVVVNSTRVIYQASKKEVTVNLTNQNSAPVLIQNWIETDSAQRESASKNVPFILTPPINRVDAGKGQTLRISYLGSPALPQDRESVFWLNILEVPAKAKDVNEDQSKLNIAFRTRIKLFYRPNDLPGTATQAMENLHWSIKGNGVNVTNSSKYYVSLFDVTYKSGGKKYDTKGFMIAPGATEFYQFKGIAVTNINDLSYSAVNDYGANVQYKAKP